MGPCSYLAWVRAAASGWRSSAKRQLSLADAYLTRDLPESDNRLHATVVPATPTVPGRIGAEASVADNCGHFGDTATRYLSRPPPTLRHGASARPPDRRR